MIDVEFAQGPAGTEPWPVTDQHPDPQQDGLTAAQLVAVLSAAILAVNDGHPHPQQDALTNAQLRASAVPVQDGHPDPQTNALTNAQLRAAALAVAGPLTNAELRAAAVTVNDGHPDPQTNGLTNAQLRAAPIPVSGGQTDALTDAQLRAAPVKQTVRDSADANVGDSLQGRYSGGKVPFSTVLSTAGDNTVITPAAGKRVRVFWASVIPNSDNPLSNLVTIKIGALTLYTCYALAHWEPFTGAVNAPVVVTLANAGPVAVTLHYQEV